MTDCPEEQQTQHYGRKWRGFGPVRNNERLIFAVFDRTPRDGNSLIKNSFNNSHLIAYEESVARQLYVTRSVFDSKIVSPSIPLRGPLVGISCADVTRLRRLRVDIPRGPNRFVNIRAICVLDKVVAGDFDGHATLGYAGVGALNVGKEQLGKVRSRIRLDLATKVFSEVQHPNNNRRCWINCGRLTGRSWLA